MEGKELVHCGWPKRAKEAKEGMGCEVTPGNCMCCGEEDEGQRPIASSRDPSRATIERPLAGGGEWRGDGGQGRLN